MKNIPKTIITIQTIMLPFWFFKHTKMQFYGLSTHLGGSFDYVFTFMNNAQNEIFNQNKKRIKKSAKEIIFDVQGVDIANQELETLENMKC